MRVFRDSDNEEIYLDSYVDGYVHLMVNGASEVTGRLFTPTTARHIANHMLKLADKVQANKKRSLNNE